MVFIYALMSGQVVLYVGQTIQTLKKREYGHRCKVNEASSKHIPDYIDWTMELLEECDEASKTIREQYYYDTLKPLYNEYRPGQTPKEYRRNNQDKRSEINRKWSKNNPDKRSEINRRYYQKKKAEATTPPIKLQEVKMDPS